MVLLTLAGWLTLATSGSHWHNAAAEWPTQLEDSKWQPRIGYLREATGIEGQLLIGPKLR